MKLMTAEPERWSDEGQKRLQEQITGPWAEDVWVFTITELPVRRWYLRFTIQSPSLSIEVKYALWKRLHPEGRNARRAPGDISHALKVICEWLNHFPSPIHSLTERSLGQWEASLQSYLIQTKQFKQRITKTLSATQEYVTYMEGDPCIALFRQLYNNIQDVYDDRPETEKDIWDVRKMGVAINLTNGFHHLNFTFIAQFWLRQLTKAFLGYRITVYSYSDSSSKLRSIITFSRFLVQCHATLHSSKLDRLVIMSYISYLREKGVGDRSRLRLLCDLRLFLETCVQRLGVQELPKERLIFASDLPKAPPLPSQELPEEVLEQLRSQLHSLPTTLLRMVVILLECGMRISELCSLSLDCLLCDDKHEWYLRFYQSKMKQEHIIPLVEKTVIEAIQAQQQEIRERWGTNCAYLFPSLATPKRPFQQGTFNQKLNKWAAKTGIRDATKRLFHFHAHQFRHSVGMRLINDDMPLDVVSRLLGHRSLAMTQIYARKRDSTVRQELEHIYRKRKTVNYRGEVLTGDARANDPEVQMARKGIRGQTLPVGGCARLVVHGPCNHANACLTCNFWLTSTEDLPRLKVFYTKAVRLKQRAQGVGNLIVLQQQEALLPQLALRIHALEETSSERPSTVDSLLSQLRADLAEMEVGLDELHQAGLLFTERYLKQHIVDLKEKIAESEGSPENGVEKEERD